MNDQGRVLFVGCGPGAADLLTVRAVRALEAADVVIWNHTLLDRQALAEHTRADAEVVEWPPATQDDIYAVFERARAEHLLVVRLKGGDPTLFGALEPELSAARERRVACEIVPGISALSAAAAVLDREVATRDAPLLLIDAAAAARAPERGVAVFGVGREPRVLAEALLGRGLAGPTPCTVVIEASRRDETVLSCTLDALAETIEDFGLGRLTLVLAGGAVHRADADPGTRLFSTPD